MRNKDQNRQCKQRWGTPLSPVKWGEIEIPHLSAVESLETIGAAVLAPCGDQGRGCNVYCHVMLLLQAEERRDGDVWPVTVSRTSGDISPTQTTSS